MDGTVELKYSVRIREVGFERKGGSEMFRVRAGIVIWTVRWS